MDNYKYYVVPNTLCPKCVKKHIEALKIECGGCGEYFIPQGPVLKSPCCTDSPNYETRG